MNEWINPKDRLPNHNETILVVTNKGGYCVSIFVDTIEMNKVLGSKGFPEELWKPDEKPYSFCSQERNGMILNGVTHWMHLPEKPK
jgi:uncharacterized protein DUF551